MSSNPAQRNCKRREFFVFARLRKTQKPTNNNSKPPAPGKFCLFFFPSLEDWYSTGKEIEKLQTFSLPLHVPVGPGSLKAKQISIYFSRDRTRQLRLLIGNSGAAFSVYLFICLFVFFSLKLFEFGEMYIVCLPLNFDDAEVRRPGADWLGVQRYFHVLVSQIISVDKVVIFNCQSHVIFNLKHQWRRMSELQHQNRFTAEPW